MQEQRFIGVYATSEMPSALGASHRPMVKRKRLWFAWEMGDGKYQVQALNAIHLPMAEPRIVAVKEFEARFTAEPDCAAEPAGCAPEGAPQPLEEPAVPGVLIGTPSPAWPLRADDPDLLRVWMEGGFSAEAQDQESLTPAQEAEMTRLLEGSLSEIVMENPNEDYLVMPGAIAVKSPAVMSESESGPQQDPEQIMRAEFALALLQLKQGRRAEGVAALGRMLARPRPAFANAALAFSEFGLSLRRIGLVRVALRAHLRALEFAPEDERVHFNLARSYHDLNNFALARKHLEQALEIAPGFTVAQQFLEFLQAK